GEPGQRQRGDDRGGDGDPPPGRGPGRGGGSGRGDDGGGAAGFTPSLPGGDPGRPALSRTAGGGGPPPGAARRLGDRGEPPRLLQGPGPLFAALHAPGARGSAGRAELCPRRAGGGG